MESNIFTITVQDELIYEKDGLVYNEDTWGEDDITLIDFATSSNWETATELCF